MERCSTFCIKKQENCWAMDIKGYRLFVECFCFYYPKYKETFELLDERVVGADIEDKDLPVLNLFFGRHYQNENTQVMVGVFYSGLPIPLFRPLDVHLHIMFAKGVCLLLLRLDL